MKMKMGTVTIPTATPVDVATGLKVVHSAIAVTNTRGESAAKEVVVAASATAGTITISVPDEGAARDVIWWAVGY
jgi:hypothetical protein